MPKSTAPQPIQILFIGNSYTQHNDLPTLIEEMAAALPQPKIVQTERILINGASLRQHWNKGEALALIRQIPWNYIVLQEQSTLPIRNPQRFHENVRLFADEIKKSKAQSALYLTWARKNAPEAQTALNDATLTLAIEIGGLIVPIGPAWQAAVAADPSLELYNPDGSHPSPAGSYLAACVFVAALFHQSPVGSIAPDSIQITEEHARLLQQIAWQIVSNESWKSKAV